MAVHRRRQRRSHHAAAAPRRRSWALLLATSSAVLLAGLAPRLGTAAAYATSDPVVAAAGDIACDPSRASFNDGNGTSTDCREKYTAALLPGVDRVLTLGDEQYACGGPAAFQQSYDPTWGRQKSVTDPVPGNHEYQTSGGADCTTNAAGYFGYFGAAAGDPAQGYYSFDLGSWHLIALNSECAQIGGCGVGSPEETWLRQDLAANGAAPCTLAYWHRPRFSSAPNGGDDTFDAFWQDLYAAQADVVLNAHTHWYERFGLQNPSSQADPEGIREFIVGTGGESYQVPSSPAVNSEVLHYGTYGVLRLTLHPGSYDWSFVPDTGGLDGSFTDSGSTACHRGLADPDLTPPTTVLTCSGSPCSTTWYRSSVTAELSAQDNAGGSGVDQTFVTSDGSTPTQTGPTYVAPFSVPETTTVRFFSTDLSGNVEATQSQQVLIDGARPSVRLTLPTAGAIVKRRTRVTVSARTSDLGTGTGAPSGVARVAFYLDRSRLLGTAPGSPYRIRWNVRSVSRGVHTLTAVATDVAGNVRTSARVRVRVQ